MSLKAVFNSIIIKPLEEEEQKQGNIIIPDLGKEGGITGTIVSVGPGHHSVTGVFVETILKVGDVVYLSKNGPVRIPFEGEEYWGAAENTVLAVIEN